MKSRLRSRFAAPLDPKGYCTDQAISSAAVMCRSDFGPHEHRICIQCGGKTTDLRVLGLVDMDVVEVHPWNAVVDDIEEADTMVFDLDPGRGISWPFVIDAALTLREILAQEGFERSWPKLTGGKGIMVPLSERISHDQAHQRNKELAARLLEVDAQRFTISAVLGARRGRLFLDYLRNGRGTTAIGTYLPRARPGCPIAAPVPWSEIENGIAPDAYNMHLLPVSPRGLYHGTGR